MIDTQKNVYHEAARILGREVGSFSSAEMDSIFDRVRTMSGVFKCEHCDTWCAVSHESGIVDVCFDCNDDIENEDDEE